MKDAKGRKKKTWRSRMLSLLTVLILCLLLIVPPLGLYYVVQYGVIEADITTDPSPPQPLQQPEQPPPQQPPPQQPPLPRRRPWPVPLSPEDTKYLNHAIVDETTRLLVCAIP